MFLRQVCKLFFMVEIFPLKIMLRGFPGGPVTKIPPSHCRGPRFNPWSGNDDPVCKTGKETQMCITDFWTQRERERVG